MQCKVSDNFYTQLFEMRRNFLISYFCIARTTFDNVLTHDAALDLELSDFKVDNDSAFIYYSHVV